MSQIIRAKFTCNERTKYAYGSESVKLNAVYGDQGTINQQWATATPSGNLEMTISNPAAQGVIEPGKSYIIEIREAAEGE